MGSFRIKNKTEYNIEAIDEIIKKELENSVASYGFFCTYDGMDLEALCKLLINIPGGATLIAKEKFMVLCGKKSAIKNDDILFSQQLLKGVKGVLVEGSFHPKVYLIKHKTQDNKEKILLIITSKNITSSVFWDAFVALSGEKTENVEETGENLKKALENIGGINVTDNEFLKDLDKYKFQLLEEVYEENPKEAVEDIKFIVPGVEKDLLKNLVEKNTQDDPLIVISPFVSDGICGEHNILLATTQEASYKLSKSIPKQLYVFYLSSNLNDDGKLREYNLHGKVYCKYCKVEDKTYLYIGSANFTYSGFGDKNKELLVRLTYKGKKIYEELKASIETDRHNWEKMEKEDLPQAGNDENYTEDNIRIPSEIYEYFEGIKVVKALKVDNDRFSIEYQCAANKKIECMDDVQIEADGKFYPIENGQVTYTEEIIYPTIMGKVVFSYKESKGNCMIFDLLKKLKEGVDNGVIDQAVLDSYNSIIQTGIVEDYEIYQKQLFTPKSIGSIINKRPDKKNTNEFQTNNQTRVSLVEDGIFEFVKYLVKKYAGNEADIKSELLEKKNKLINKLPEEQDKFLNYILEHSNNEEK